MKIFEAPWDKNVAKNTLDFFSSETLTSDKKWTTIPSKLQEPVCAEIYTQVTMIIPTLFVGAAAFKLKMTSLLFSMFFSEYNMGL